MNRKWLFLCFLVFTSCILFGCKTAMKNFDSVPTAELKSDSISLNNGVSDTLSAFSYTDFARNRMQYNWLSYRANMRADWNNGGADAALFFVNRKDSLIYINISKMGIELFRLVATPDSVKYLNRLEGTYALGDYTLLRKKFGVQANFDMLQAFFTAQDFEHFENEHFSATTTADTLRLEHAGRRATTQPIKLWQLMMIDKVSSHILSNYVRDIRTNRELNVDYGKWTAEVANGSVFPKTIRVAVPNANLVLMMNLKNVRLNVPGPTNFSIPKKYKPIN